MVSTKNPATQSEIMRNPRRVDQQKPKAQKKKTTKNYEVNYLQDVPEWMQDFKENLVDKNVQPHPYSPSSSHELSTESRAKVVPGSAKHSVNTHFPKDPNCDICLKSKITRASCRRRAGTVVPRAEILVNQQQWITKFL